MQAALAFLVYCCVQNQVPQHWMIMVAAVSAFMEEEEED